jgi:alginate O-acetyltransferase complex protein AlgI
MLFCSQIFLFYFLPFFMLLYAALGRRWRIPILTVFSYVFYGWWNWRFVFLLFFATTLDYVFGLAIHRSNVPRVRRVYIVASVIMNLTLLGFFKYFMFASRSLAEVCAWLGTSYPSALLALKITLPVGISFYTFQSLSYTIDIYRNQAKPTRNFMDFACYVSMFPQLVAGPIVRYTHIETQLHTPFFSAERIYAGFQFVILGLSKKVLLADSASILANALFDSPNLAAASGWDAVLGVLAYAVQIYFDFSGYSDMAIGLGYFVGYEFPINFNSPYKSTSIAEFWRRWHITLSTWLRDYLYIPLGGSRHGTGKTYRNLALTMLLGGLWHGASWHYVVWGAYHGVLLAIERAQRGRNVLQKIPRLVQGMMTFALVNVGWVLFRAPDLPSALVTLGKVFGSNYRTVDVMNVVNAQVGLAAIGMGLVLAFFFRNTWEIGREAKWWKTLGLLMLFILCIGFLFGAVSHPFLYYQF